MNIETQRLTIRDFVPEDAAALHEILSDAETMEFCEPPYTPEQTREFLDEFLIGRHGGAAVVLRESGRLIGYLLFNELEDGLYELGWFFNRAFWRQGYAYEASCAVLDYAFDELDAHKVFAETADAQRAAPLLDKLGMRLEGVQRSQTTDNHGNWLDMYLYGMLREDRADN